MWPQSQKFWHAADSFFARVASDTERASTYRKWVRRSRQPERARKSYRYIQSRLSRLPSDPSQATAIRLDPAYRGMLLDLIGHAAETVGSEVDTLMASLAFNAWRRWPVDTGFSKALLSLEYTEGANGELLASLHSNAWYSFYIKTKRNGLANQQPWRVLIFNAADAKVEATAIRIAETLAAGRS